MKRPKIAIAGFQHETNTFAPMPTPFEEFERGGAWPGITTGQGVIDAFAPLNVPVGGFICAAGDMDLVPILWAGAEPAGYVEQAGFDRIAGMIVDAVAGARDLDGVYLDLHGAMVTDAHEDGEGELVRRIREVVGPYLPIAVSLDLHGNLTPEFAAMASSVAIYRTYPHIDMAETGARAAALLRAELDRGSPFARAYRQVGFIPPINEQSTMREPGGRLYGMLLRKKVPVVKTTDHKVGIGLYFTDPDGHRFEFFCETVHDDAQGKRLLGAYNAPSDPDDLQPL